MRELTKTLYRLKCRVLAKRIAELELSPSQIPNYLGRHAWFMEMQGVVSSAGAIRLTSRGAIGLFGQDWCNRCIQEELIATGKYIEDSIHKYQVLLKEKE